MERLEPNDLLIFAQVIDSGGFTRAARRLGLPKSSMSRRIALLEDRLGERLMIRTTRRLTLTDLGERVLAHARQIQDEVDAVRALAEHRRLEPSGRLRVSMPSDIATLLVAGMLSDYVTRYPGVTLELDLSPGRVDILGGGFDLAVRTGDLPDDGLLAARRLAIFPIGLYASPAYLARWGEPEEPADLPRHALLKMPGRDAREATWILTAGSRAWEGDPAPRVAANSPETLIQLAVAGIGIAAIPDCYAARGLAQGELRRVLAPWSLPAHTASAVFPGRRLMPSKTRLFLEMLGAALRDAPGAVAAG
jgi:DNA-binding transcriptional LysR family regulator